MTPDHHLISPASVAALQKGLGATGRGERNVVKGEALQWEDLLIWLKIVF